MTNPNKLSPEELAEIVDGTIIFSESDISYGQEDVSLCVENWRAVLGHIAYLEKQNEEQQELIVNVGVEELKRVEYTTQAEKHVLRADMKATMAHADLGLLLLNSRFWDEIVSKYREFLEQTK